MNTVPLIKNFFEALNTRKIQYCHWKSNHLIHSFLEGKGDLDILALENSQKDFEDALSDFGFKLIVSPAWEQTPSVFHYYGLDTETGIIVHIHIYFKLMTGGMLIKNYELPLARLLLESSSESKGINLPDQPSELLTFVIRKILECGSLPDFLFIVREDENIKKELNWLMHANTVNEAKDLLPRFLPELTPELFDECIRAVQSKPQFFHRSRLAKRLQKVLSNYATNTPLKNKILSWIKFSHVVSQKFIVKKSAFKFFKGGLYIAFVGADASGKSSHALKVEEWMKKFVAVNKIHSGKPPATLLTYLPRLFLPFIRKLLPGQRTNFVEFKTYEKNFQDKKKTHYSYVYLIRSIMIAYEQRSLINKARRLANSGEIIISDRHPSSKLGGMDGRRVVPSFFEQHSPVKRILARIENNIYDNIPKPDIVFKLSVPFELNLQRFLERGEEIDSETEELMRSRRAVMDKWELPGVPVHEIDNSSSPETVQNKIRGLIWDSI